MAQTVLIVEDEIKIRELLRSYFEREGYAVLTTGSGAEAIALTSSSSTSASPTCRARSSRPRCDVRARLRS